MKTIFTQYIHHSFFLMLLFFSTINMSIFAQKIDVYDYDQKTELSEKLEDNKKIYKKLRIKKTKREEEIQDSLKKEIKKAKKDLEKIPSLDINKQKEVLIRARLDKTTNKNDFDDETRKYGEAKTKSTDYENQLKILKAKAKSNDKIKEEYDSLTRLNISIQKQIDELIGNNKKVSEEITTEPAIISGEVSNLKINISKLEKSIKDEDKNRTKIETDIKGLGSLNNEITNLNNSINGLNTNIITSMGTEVASTINSRDYSLTKVKMLLAHCDNPLVIEIASQQVNTWKSQLNAYKQIAETIEESKKVIGNKYDKTAKDNALAKLQGLYNTTIPQKEDVEKYKLFLEKYCEMTFEVYASTAGLSGFLPDYPEEVQKEMRNFLGKNPEVKNYPFLLREVNGFINNGFYKSSVQKIDCK